MKKIRLLGLLSERNNLLKVVQEAGALEIIEEKKDLAGQNNLSTKQKLDLRIAKLDFVIDLLKPLEPKRGILEGPPQHTIDELEKLEKNTNTKELIEQCENIEAKQSEIKNRLVAIHAQKDELMPWINLKLKLSELSGTKTVKILLGKVPLENEEAFRRDLILKDIHLSYESIQKDKRYDFFMLTLIHDLAKSISTILQTYKVEEVMLPQNHETTVSELLTEMQKEANELENKLSQLNKEITELAKQNWDIKAIRDYLYWQKERMEAEENTTNTAYSFTITGWVPEKRLAKLEKQLGQSFKSFHLEEIQAEEDEKVPVALENKGILKPFEAVTNVYGLPLPTEVDPTPFLATFFIIFFGLCLTDAGYGLVLFALTALMLKFMKMPEGTKKLVKLIMFGGIVTFIAGIFFGGYFGLTPDQAPAFMTEMITNSDGNQILAFKWQKINPVTDPIIFLILAAILGVIQVLFGILLDGYWKLKQGRYMDAALDSGLWFLFLSTMIVWAMSGMGMFLPEAKDAITMILYIELAALVLTQGRSQKNIIAKFGMGVLSLYNIVGYVSDVLSYSRIMALGLGTGIIAFAMNTIAGIVGNLIPYVGFIAAIGIILAGHTLNLALSALGAFIHSARLQFVEFFGKFMEGGGKAFSPFKRTCKYIWIKE